MDFSTSSVRSTAQAVFLFNSLPRLLHCSYRKALAKLAVKLNLSLRLSEMPSKYPNQTLVSFFPPLS